MASKPKNPALSAFMSPSGTSLYGDELDDAIQLTIRGITGINGMYVRPRWVPEPPSPPQVGENWVAFGIVLLEADKNTFQWPSADGESLIVEQDETLHVLHSFYGPHSQAMASRYRAGLAIDANRAQLRLRSLGIVDIGDSVSAPELFNEQYRKRIDVTVLMRRRTQHTYGIRTIQAAEVGLDNEHYVTPIYSR